MTRSGERHGPWLALAVACAIAGCACGACSGGGAGGGYEEVDSAGVTIVTSAAPAEEWTLPPEPELSLGVVEGGPTEFYRVGGIAPVPGGRLAIVNGGTEQIRFFSSAGAYLGAVGGAGRGPREYRGLYWLAPFGDSLVTYDAGNDRLSVRGADGGFGRTFRLEWHYGIVTPVLVLPDRTLLAVTARHMVELSGTGLVLDSGLVARYDASGAMLDSIGRFPHNQRVVRRAGELQTTLGLPFSAAGRFAAWPDGFCYAFGSVAEVMCYDLSGGLVRIARLALAPEPVTTADIEAYWERELASRNERYVQALRRMRDDMVFPEHLPAFSDLRTDDRGRVWARRYSRPGAAQAEWLVLDHGRWVARLTVDPAFQLRAIHGGRVYGVWRDELGVEYVRGYRLLGPEGG